MSNIASELQSTHGQNWHAQKHDHPSLENDAPNSDDDCSDEVNEEGHTQLHQQYAGAATTQQSVSEVIRRKSRATSS